MIRFLLNQTLREESSISPNMTVLNYLREHIAKTGTKEGCGSGDCGACTVVLGEVVDGSLSYRSVNACLTFVSALHGKQLITVEDLRDKTSLHPVQQAMVEHHGSQCGFCTPGFIMSMFALTKNKPNADKEETYEALAGNLCRCTGYRPIVEAALSLSQSQPIRDQFAELEKETIARLSSIAPPNLEHQFDGKSAFTPQSSDELADVLLAHPNARLLAGGTDLALEVTQFYRDIDELIYVGQVNDIKVVKETDTHIEIGANVPLTDVYSALTPHYPDFGTLIQRFASLQIRNQGTVGGNIANASPIGDAPPLLIALGASIELRRGDAVREIPIEDFFKDYKVTALQPSEFIQTIRIPKPQTEQMFKAYKISKRFDDDISAVCGAFRLTFGNDANGSDIVTCVRIAFGGMAATPARATNSEQALLGKPLSTESIQAAMLALEHDFAPITDFRASKEYRLETAANLLYRMYIEQRLASYGKDAASGNTIATRVIHHVS
ncbi:xanthine dehydrogenase small subunit [Enterovibrio norvegicus]|uniref:Xanthine dehydrogenase small subunit n=2 Tax=Enterovibrio norvegicus TaxID=188144 RepID=A0A1I5LNX1_9GAMM|nr:xanthine dehydrogenase small subunit [Enterovibrio norvegicus]MCC4798571.1 xanthine dehydrogenase small subunit [Enterovibrio norvegicus]OEF57034.1 xanthine dehydrogenase small subunit [Enterovibrio norvegicus]PMH67758.1 xanthine dehydrogenase small subunit [Enterovibrio norvegicus]PMI28712.1 xanthine dehydrogenase small subunit [Enterovibrio norvegicus]PMI36995.1 xanthine dehydrogenase small subunit [Enterovibrio norvegicus]